MLFYPFGLTMAGISSKALNGAVENKKKYNGIDWEDDFDLAVYDAFYRELDPQIGRWWQVDPEIESMEAWSPYASNFDNPITFSDPLGDVPDCPECKEVLDGVGETVNKLLISAGSTMNGFLNSVSFGLWPTNPAQSLGLASGYTGSNAQLHNNSVLGGQVLALGFSAARAPNMPSVAVADGTAVAAPKNIPLPAVPMPNANSSSSDQSSGSSSGKRRENRLLDKGEPNSTLSNKQGTTIKKYGPDGNVQKEFNKGHTGKGTPKNEKNDHIHDYKPNPKNPSGRGEKRYPGREPKKGELKKDFGL